MPGRAEIQAQLAETQAALQELGAAALGTADELSVALEAVSARDVTIGELRQALADCEDTQPPPPPPPAEALIVPGTGEVVFEDLLTTANPSEVYGAQSTPWSDGYKANGQDDPYLPILTDDPCPHIPVGRTEPTPRYRRHVSKPGIESLGDIGKDHTRTQTQKWSDKANPSAQPPGKYVIYYSVRPAYDRLPNPIGDGGGGNTRTTQLFQFKSHSGGTGTFLSVSCSVGNDGISLISRDRRGDRVTQQVVSLPDRWNRLALVCDWRDGGWFELWSDVDGEMVKRTQRVTNATLLNGNPKFSPGIGPYHQLDLFDEDYWSDHTNFQICRYSGE